MKYTYPIAGKKYGFITKTKEHVGVFLRKGESKYWFRNECGFIKHLKNGAVKDMIKY